MSLIFHPLLALIASVTDRERLFSDNRFGRIFLPEPPIERAGTDDGYQLFNCPAEGFAELNQSFPLGGLGMHLRRQTGS